MLSILALILATSGLVVNAAVVKHEKGQTLEPSRSLWKPSKLASFGGGTFCFVAQDGSCSSAVCPESLLCFFNSGDSVSSPEITLPYCGDRGVVADGNLHCPHELVPTNASNHITYSVTTFSPNGATLTGSLSVDRVFTFDVAKLPGLGKATELLFTGNQVRMGEGSATFFLSVTTVGANGTKTPILFRSSDGFSWTSVSELPLSKEASSYHTVPLGETRIAVISEGPGGFQRVISNYQGRYWSDVKKLNTTAPPFALTYPSGLVLEYATANHTPLAVEYRAEGVSKSGKKIFRLSGETKAPKKAPVVGEDTSSYAVAFKPSADRIVTIYDGVDPKGKRQLRMSSFHVNDSEEKKAQRQKQEKEAKRKADADAALEQARLDRIERQAAARRERRQMALYRQKAFDVADEPNLALAKKNMVDGDGEFIVVRQSRKDTVDLERNAFFW